MAETDGITTAQAADSIADERLHAGQVIRAANVVLDRGYGRASSHQ
jgi:hypothetical protein